jgi:hypothetical protein
VVVGAFFFVKNREKKSREEKKREKEKDLF